MTIVELGALGMLIVAWKKRAALANEEADRVEAESDTPITWDADDDAFHVAYQTGYADALGFAADMLTKTLESYDAKD
jgi:hypothetical protein